MKSVIYYVNKKLFKPYGSNIGESDNPENAEEFSLGSKRRTF